MSQPTVPTASACPTLAWRQLRRGGEILQRGRVVVTDRLHGHILSLLLGIPHVLRDNSYGKVSAFHTTWTQGCELTHWTDSAPEALAKARLLTTRSG